MKARTTWVLIADGGHARVLRAVAPEHRLEPVEGMTFAHELPPTHELVDDRQARSFESVGKQRHPVSTGLDPHRKEKEKFAVEIAAVLDRHCDAYDRLVVAAPAKAMGELRAAYSEKVREKIDKEVVKDLVKTPDAEIASHLGFVPGGL